MLPSLPLGLSHKANPVLHRPPSSVNAPLEATLASHLQSRPNLFIKSVLTYTKDEKDDKTILPDLVPL